MTLLLDYLTLRLLGFIPTEYPRGECVSAFPLRAAAAAAAAGLRSSVIDRVSRLHIA